ncbi:MAG: YqgE/AlgH family protein [Gammaproteobacteria bacterium]|nr:YqgE/AlgH family protein [Gammaproteobacteria bacterium]
MTWETNHIRELVLRTQLAGFALLLLAESYEASVAVCVLLPLLVEFKIKDAITFLQNDYNREMWRIKDLWAICFALGFVLAGESVVGGSFYPVSIAPALPDTRSENPGPGMFLVATRGLDGSHFGRSVVYLVAHGNDGTLGLIVNRSSDISLSEALPDLEHEQATTHALYYGGPVGLPMILMLMRSESATEGMENIADDVYISSERRLLEEALAAKKPERELRFYLGYSGWATGQLDSELVRGSWHVIAADADAIFSGETDSLWNRLIERLEPIGIQVDSQPSLPTLALAAN